MQLLLENKAHMTMVRDFNMSASITMKDTSSNLEVKEKASSNASLLLMNPVASGDNVATDLNSAHRLKEELPPLVPCCEGKELQINEDLVRSGLSAISVKHDSVIQCLSMSQACEKMQVPPGLVKHRNSFRSLHRPDLKRVPYLRRMTADELETLFRGYSDFPTKHDRIEHKNKSKPEEVTRLTLPTVDSRANEAKNKNASNDHDSNESALHAILEARSGTEDVPAGMRLHGARARLYTSVLAGAKTGDQLDTLSTSDYDSRVPEDTVLPEDEVQLHEELQIILPPRCDDVTPDSITAASTDTFA